MRMKGGVVQIYKVTLVLGKSGTNVDSLRGRCEVRLGGVIESPSIIAYYL